LRRDFLDPYRQHSEKNELKPHLNKTWCLGKIDAKFIAQMEEILQLYARPYDPYYPVVCFDERPCFLLGEEIEPLAMQSGQVRKEHYAYVKNGSCSVLAAIEPLTGHRFAQVSWQRTKKEFTQFAQRLAATYPEAKKIHLVLDNLNTHNAGSFYQNLPAAEAFALAQCFEFHYTPKSASWLNMTEIEFSAIARQCLNRRIPLSSNWKKKSWRLSKSAIRRRSKSSGNSRSNRPETN
jgi:DDE superfamily endonuclease